MQILQTIITIDDTVSTIDTIEHEGSLWLVPKWKYSKDARWMSPEVVIPMPKGYTHIGQGEAGKSSRTGTWHYMIQDPIPKAVLDGTANWAELARYGARAGPDIQIEVGGTH